MNAHNPLPEVTKFVVKIASSQLSEAVWVRNQLNAEFPDLVFRFEPNESDSKQKVVIVPVMEDQNGRAHLCRAPQRNLITQIHNKVIDELILAYAKVV